MTHPTVLVEKFHKKAEIEEFILDEYGQKKVEYSHTYSRRLSHLFAKGCAYGKKKILNKERVSLC